MHGTEGTELTEVEIQYLVDDAKAGSDTAFSQLTEYVTNVAVADVQTSLVITGATEVVGYFVDEYLISFKNLTATAQSCLFDLCAALKNKSVEQVQEYDVVLQFVTCVKNFSDVQVEALSSFFLFCDLLTSAGSLDQAKTVIGWFIEESLESLKKLDFVAQRNFFDLCIISIYKSIEAQQPFDEATNFVLCVKEFLDIDEKAVGPFIFLCKILAIQGVEYAQKFNII